MNIESVVAASRECIRLAGRYSKTSYEKDFDRLFFGYLNGSLKFGADRQVWLQMAGRKRPARVDFRTGGTNPVVIELAFRPPSGGGQLTAKVNRSELRKLCRFGKTIARSRLLLLVDLYKTPLSKLKVKDAYERVSSGPGNFARHSVRVIYVHRSHTFNFSWSP